MLFAVVLAKTALHPNEATCEKKRVLTLDGLRKLGRNLYSNDTRAMNSWPVLLRALAER